MSVYIDLYKQSGSVSQQEKDDGRTQIDMGLAFYDAASPPAEIHAFADLPSFHPRPQNVRNGVCIDLTHELECLRGSVVGPIEK